MRRRGRSYFSESRGHWSWPWPHLSSYTVSASQLCIPALHSCLLCSALLMPKLVHPPVHLFLAAPHVTVLISRFPLAQSPLGPLPFPPQLCTPPSLHSLARQLCAPHMPALLLHAGFASKCMKVTLYSFCRVELSCNVFCALLLSWCCRTYPDGIHGKKAVCTASSHLI